MIDPFPGSCHILCCPYSRLSFNKLPKISVFEEVPRQTDLAAIQAFTSPALL
jgi:hypothetical protein